MAASGELAPYPVSQSTGKHVRELSEEEKAKLEADKTLVSEFKQNKLEKEAQKNWDLFYKRNTTKFFKDRHWTTREFSELCGRENASDKLVLLEVGCGVGNFLFPLLEDDPNLFVYACDFSPRAVQFVKDNPLYSLGRCKAFQHDLTKDTLTDHVPPASVDIVTMIFVLSAIHPDRMVAALRNIHTVLKPGGRVLLRDYGLFDHAQLRFSSGHKLQENFYVRQDGTRAYYFPKEELESLFREAGFDVGEHDYIMRQTVNKKENLCVPRVFVQGKFVKCQNQAVEAPAVSVGSGTVSVGSGTSSIKENVCSAAGTVSMCSGTDTSGSSDAKSSEPGVSSFRNDPSVDGLIGNLQKDILNTSNSVCSKES